MVYMLYDSTTTDINDIIINDTHFANTFIIDKYDNNKNIIGIVCNDIDIQNLINHPDCLGSNDTDLALKYPDIAKQILKVNVDDNGIIKTLPICDVTKSMQVKSQPISPIVIFSSND